MQYGGYVCFVFTDMEGSTPLWEQHPAQMREAHQLHSHILSECTTEAGGRVFKTVGDAFCCAFPSVAQGLAAAEKIQAQIASAPWPAPCPIRVRAAVHWGMPLVDGNDFQGPEVNLVARLLSQASAGQVLVSQAARDAQDAHELLFLGKAALRGIEQPVGVYQLGTDTFAALPGLNQAPTNLRPRPTQLLGREDELARLTEATQASRCISLVGPGGVGKTHLVTEFALSQRANFPDGVWFVDFVELQSGADVEPFVLSLLCPKTTAPWDALRDKRLLVVLDNCEHVLDSARAFVRRMLAETPAQVMTTTRELLGVPGERRFPVAPLKEAAVQLFRERCLEVNPELPLALLDQYAPKIVAAFDGFPLAIVLAAALPASYPLHVLHEMVVSGKGVSAVEGTEHKRHSSVRATIEWSYNLLSATDKRVLERATVFAGSMDFTALTYVVAFGEVEEADVIQALARLTRSSLMQLDAATGRYSLYQPIREFATEQLLLHADEEAEAVSRHIVLAFQLVEEARAQYDGLNSDVWMRRLEVEHANLRQALVSSSDSELKARIVGGLQHFWVRSGHVREGLALTHGIVSRLKSADPRLQCATWNTLAVLQWTCGLLEDAEASFAQAHEFAEHADGDTTLRAMLLTNHALVQIESEKAVDALKLLEQAKDLYEETGNHFSRCVVSLNMGATLLQLARWQEAQLLLSTASTEAKQKGYVALALALDTESLSGLLRAGTVPDGALQTAREIADRAKASQDKIGVLIAWGLMMLIDRTAVTDFQRGFWAAGAPEIMAREPWLVNSVQKVIQAVDNVEGNPGYNAGRAAWEAGLIEWPVLEGES